MAVDIAPVFVARGLSRSYGAGATLVQALRGVELEIGRGRIHRGARPFGQGPLRVRVRLVEPAALTKVSALGVEEQRVNVVLDFADSPRPCGRSETASGSMR